MSLFVLILTTIIFIGFPIGLKLVATHYQKKGCKKTDIYYPGYILYVILLVNCGIAMIETM